MKCRSPETFANTRASRCHRNRAASRPNPAKWRERTNECESRGNYGSRLPRSDLNRIEAWRNGVVSPERDIVERGRIAAPARRIRVFDAHDMSRRPHVNAALSQRPSQQPHFHFYGGPSLDFTWR